MPITLTRDIKPLTVELARGVTIRGRIRDVQGRPVAGAFVAVEAWRGQRTISFRTNTDSSGSFAWNDAPDEAVEFSIGKTGYLYHRDLALAPGKDHELTLYPQVVIRGTVRDQETGEALDRARGITGFRFRGQRDIHWDNRAAFDVTGTYSVKFDEPREGYFIRVERPGYRTYESPMFNPLDGPQVHDVQLEPGAPDATVRGIVLRPDGSAAENQRVTIGTRETRIQLTNGQIARSGRERRVTTDSDGRFQFTRPDDAFLILVAAPEGIGYLLSEKTAKAQQNRKLQVIRLQPWGRIQGQLAGSLTRSKQQLHYRPRGFSGDRFTSLSYRCESDGEGRFVLERVLPGPGSLSRVVRVNLPGGYSNSWYGWQQALDVAAGGVTEVALGGNGRIVRGRVGLVGEPEGPVQWQYNEPLSLTRLDPATKKQAEFYERYLATVEADGVFRIENVPPGMFKLSLPVNLWIQ